MIIEGEKIDPLCRIRQGDLLEWNSKNKNWQEFAVIITADCDIANNKNDDIFSYCPILTLETYVLRYFIFKKIKIQAVLDITKKMIDKKFISKGYKDLDIDINLIINMIKDSSSKEFLSTFEITDKKICSYLYFIEKYFSEDLDPIQLLIDYKFLDSKDRDKKKVLTKLETEIQEFVRRLPGDLFYFNYINNIDRIGYIVNLRRIGMLKKEEILTNFNSSNKYLVKRVGKLCSPFSYRLTQKVGQMFSDIGLPKKYEDDCKAAVTVLVDNIRSEYE